MAQRLGSLRSETPGPAGLNRQRAQASLGIVMVQGDRYFGGSALGPSFYHLSSCSLPPNRQPCTCPPESGVTEARVPLPIPSFLHSSLSPLLLEFPSCSHPPEVFTNTSSPPFSLALLSSLSMFLSFFGRGKTEVPILAKNRQGDVGIDLRKGPDFTDRPGFKP